MVKNTLLIVGLGNPGEKYAHTRHNAGFEVMSRLEEYYGVKLRKRLLLQGMTAEVTDGETKVVLCEPLTFMNRSGDCVKKLLNRFKVPQENMIVIYDDIDLPPGKVRVRKTADPERITACGVLPDSLGRRIFQGSAWEPATVRRVRTWRPGCWGTGSRKIRRSWKRPLTRRRNARGFA